MNNLIPVNEDVFVDRFVLDFKYRFGPSSITEADGHLFLVWTEPDRSPKIFLSVYEDRKWSPPETLFEVTSSKTQVYDPSIHCIGGELHLFFAVGSVAEGRPKGTKGYCIKSSDLGVSWTSPRRLPFSSPSAGSGIVRSDDRMLFVCQDGSDIEFVYRSAKGEWFKQDGLPPSDYTLGMPILIQHKSGVVQLLARSSYKRILTAFLESEGVSWSPVGLTEIPVPNSTIDAICLNDGRILVAYNHSESKRRPLCVAVSENGYAWRLGTVIDDRDDQLTFPRLHQDAAGNIHLIYTRRKAREVVHCVVGANIAW